MRRAVAVLALCAACVSAPRPGNVEHVVLMWLKQPGDQATIDRLAAVSRTFPQRIDGITSMSIGTALPNAHDVVDDSFDLALVMRFSDAEALAAYSDHPVHVRAVEDVLAPAVERFLVYDVVVGPR